MNTPIHAIQSINLSKSFSKSFSIAFSKSLICFALLLSLLALGGCSSDEASTQGSDSPWQNNTNTGESPGVGQGGAQDFGLFRQIVEEGGIPSPEVMDDVGFFNEHKLVWPAPDCGDDLCIHGLLGVMGNLITNSNCTLVLLGLNTPIDPTTIVRPPLNLAIAVDVSGSMSGDSIEYLREGLLEMLTSLQVDDRVSLILYNNNATLVSDHLSGSDPALKAAILAIRAEGATNLYGGLSAAFEAVDAHRAPGVQNRVILLSDGVATAGINNDARIQRLATAYATQGIGITSIGIGEEFNVSLMRSIAETGSGNFYFLNNPEAVREVFAEEIDTFLLPLAEDVRIRFKVGGGYTLRRMYGTKLAVLDGDTGYIDIPSLFIAGRTSTDHTDPEGNTGGRRGGGGSIIAELMPSGNPSDGFDPNEIGQLIMEYRVPGTEEYRTQEIAIRSPLLPGETPAEGHFESNTVAKGFVMLNLFVGMEMASARAQAGDNNSAIQILQSLEGGVQNWLLTNPDDDIEDDLRLLRLFRDNIALNRAVQSVPEGYTLPEPWPAD